MSEDVKTDVVFDVKEQKIEELAKLPPEKLAREIEKLKDENAQKRLKAKEQEELLKKSNEEIASIKLELRNARLEKHGIVGEDTELVDFYLSKGLDENTAIERAKQRITKQPTVEESKPAVPEKKPPHTNTGIKNHPNSSPATGMLDGLPDSFLKMTGSQKAQLLESNPVLYKKMFVAAKRGEK